MDSYNPTDPQKMNHVILHVNDGQYDYNIEATALQNGITFQTVSMVGGLMSSSTDTR